MASPSPRQARLRPQFAELYPALQSGAWVPAAEVGAALLRWIAGGGATPPLGSRLLPDEHFDFRGGVPTRETVAPARTRLEDAGSGGRRVTG